MALKGLDIFKLTPRTNCKECGHPTCMAFAMKVAQGTVNVEQCTHMSAKALETLAGATAPPMKTVVFGAGDSERSLGGETVLFRHEKSFVSESLFGVSISSDNTDGSGRMESLDAQLAIIAKIDYERIGKRMIVDVVNVEYRGDKEAFLCAVKQASDFGRAVILEVSDTDAAKAALDLVKEKKPILNGANAKNYKEFFEIASKAGVPLGVTGATLDEIHETIKGLEESGAKNLIIDVGSASVKEAFTRAVQVRRASIKDKDRVFGYPTIVNISKLSRGCPRKETGLAALFTLKYGSIIIMSNMSYAQALPLFGLRQNIFTDPQKPMTVETGVYPLNVAKEDSPCAITVDFALTYFIVSGEIERSGVPVNLLIPDAGGYSVLTAWAAGKLSAGSIAKFVKEHDIESKIKSRELMIPGKVAVLKGELEESLSGWTIVVAPNEAVSLVKFLRERYS